MPSSRLMGANHWLDPLREGERGPDAKGMYMWAALSAGPVWDIAHGRSHPVWLAVPAVLAAAAGYLVTVHLAFSDRRRAQLHALPLLAAVVLPSVIGFQGNWFYLQVMLAIAVGTAITTRWLPIVGLVLCGVTFAVRFATGGTVGESLVLVWSVATAALIPAMIIRLWEAIRELQRTREELAELAVAEERLRFARDLHDLLGHTLSVMVVKAEAVRRLAPRDGQEAARQAADIEEIGRKALAEVRAAVTGYRGKGFAAELASARKVLADAGITAVLRVAEVRIPPEAGALLGWAVREGVTNVIRHSGARRCEIELRTGDEGLVLEIRDDGSGNGAAATAGAPTARRRGTSGGAPEPRRGHGLVGLRERLAAVGGTLEAGPLAGGGFLLRVTVPYEGDDHP
nr:sensor histidine kinase [Actinomycetales bacterium]